jgi:hypothetical protein
MSPVDLPRSRPQSASCRKTATAAILVGQIFAVNSSPIFHGRVVDVSALLTIGGLDLKGFRRPVTAFNVRGLRKSSDEAA